MPEGRLVAVAEQFRRELLQRERKAARELVRAYGEAWQRIKQRLDDLTRQIEQAEARGEDVSPSWLFEQERLQTLQRQVEAELREFARFAEQRIIAEQAEAVRAAADHTEQLTLAALGEPPPGVTVIFARLPTQALSDLVGFLQNGSPLRDLLDELGPEASQAVRDALIAGVATGQNPRTIARQVRQALGGNLVRALTIGRTEVLRSYRTASLRSYQANSDIMRGWVWHAALDRRTCAFCWSQHGEFHEVTERFATHPRCRCSPLPQTKTWQELGFEDVPETRVELEKGRDLFERLSAERKREILGPAKFAAYQEGKLKLADVAGFRRDRKWGPVGYERSLRDILGETGAAPASQPAGEKEGLR